MAKQETERDSQLKHPKIRKKLPLLWSYICHSILLVEPRLTKY